MLGRGSDPNSAVDWAQYGFEMVHTPGVARALVKVDATGSEFIVTDEEGFDLPDPDGPFQLMELTREGEMVGTPQVFAHSKDVIKLVESRMKDRSGS